MAKKERRSIRWWPAVVIIALYGLALVLVRSGAGTTYQERFVHSAMISALALLLLFIWWLLLSRAPWKLRLGLAALPVLAAVALAKSLTLTGVSGDLVPVLEWTWQKDEAVAVQSSLAKIDPEAVGEFPQFLGPDRNAVLVGPRLAGDWQQRGPLEIWRRPVGEGWSGFAVVGGRALTQEQHGALEKVRAYDVMRGELVWEHEDEARYETKVAGIGPRATPTIDDGTVFTLGATGILNALELATGRLLWSSDIHADSGAANKEWGRSCSPLVVDGLVVVSAGGAAGKSLLAYARDSGEIVWTAGSDPSSYSSPLLTTLAGRRQIVILNRTSVTGHDIATGEILWRHPWETPQPSVAQPVALDGRRLLVSAGYGKGSELLSFTAATDGSLAVEVVWKSPRLKAKFANFVLHEGYVYGLDDGVLVCLDPETGERCWKSGRYGHGQLLLVGELLLVTTEFGDVVLVKPTPDEHRELGRFAAFERKTWNSPALVGRYLLIRNDAEAALFELPVG